MTNEVTRKLTGYRWVETQWGDTLQRIALREFGEASRWAELAHLNNLVPPYITDDPLLAGDKVLLSGKVIMIPAATPSASQETDPEKVYGRDIFLLNGKLVAENGDFALVSGVKNLSQALKHRILTAPGELVFHGDYGCDVHRIIGKVNNSTAVLLAAQYVRSGLEKETRIARVSQSTAESSGDVIRVNAEVVPISGDPVAISADIS